MRSIARLAALAAFLLPASSVFAQVVYDTPGGRIPMELASGEYSQWPRTTAATPTGVNSSATGTAMVTAPNGTKIPVPVTATVSPTQADIAKAAAARATATPRGLGPAAGGGAAAAVLAELLNPSTEPNGSGWVACGFGNLFLCKEIPSTSAPVTAYCFTVSGTCPEWHPSQSAACEDRWIRFFASRPSYDKGYSGPSRIIGTGCYVTQTSTGSDYLIGTRSSAANGICPDGSSPNASLPLAEQCTGTGTGEYEPATADDVEQTLQEKMDADYAAGQRLWEALKADQAAMDAANQQYPAAHDPVNADTPVSVNAPPVTSPERTTKVETIPRSDGSTDTATTKEQTTVEPQTTGTKYGDTKTTFPSKTTSTTTVVNNVTNNTTVTTTVVNHPVMQAEDGPHPDLPDDYAREKTLQETRDALKTAGAADMADQGAVVEASKTKNDADLDTLFNDSETGVDADKDRFFSWVWTPPVGTCSPFAGTVHGYEISWDLCPTIESINAVIGWLFALFSATTVYGQIFKRND